MILLLVLVTVLLMVYLGLIKTSTAINPLTFFLIFWGLWVCVSTLNPYHLYNVSEKTYLLIWINMLSFSVGFVAISKKKNMMIFVNTSLTQKIDKLLLFLDFFLLIVLAFYYVKYNFILSTTVITDARRISSEIGYIFGNYAEYIMYNYFITAALYLNIIINSVKYSIDKKKSASLIITLINIYLFAGIGLGRFVFFNTIVFIVIAFSIYHSPNELNKKFIDSNAIKRVDKKKSKVKYVPILLLAIYLMTINTATRYGASIHNLNSFWRWFNFSIRQGAIYFLGPFRALDSFLQINSNNTFGFTFGRATLGGLEEIVSTLYILMGLNIKTANLIMASFTVDPILISYDGEKFNAFYTGITNFYLDGGLSFVIMIPFMFGIIVAYCWNLYNKEPSLYTLCILVFMVKASIAYQYRWDFSSPSNWVVIFALFWLYRNEKKYKVSKL